MSDAATPPDIFDERNVDEERNPTSFLSERRYFETVLLICEFDGRILSKLTLHPVNLRVENPRPERG